MKKTHLALAVLLIGLMAMTVGCRRVDLSEEGDKTTESVRAQGAERVEAEIHMGPGDLTVTGGATKLMEGVFRYSDGRLAPEIDYRVDDGVGELDMRQDTDGNWFPWGSWGGAYSNDWEVAFDDSMPMELRVQLGAGDSVFDLGDTMLEELRIETGAGTIDVDVSGSEALEELRVSAGAGDVNVDASGGATLREFGFETGAGSLKLDLTGDEWAEDIEGRINAGAGDVRITLPEGYRIEVRTDSGIGDVSASGLVRDGETWVNRDRVKGGPTIQVFVNQGVGSVTLEVE